MTEQNMVAEYYTLRTCWLVAGTQKYMWCKNKQKSAEIHKSQLHNYTLLVVVPHARARKLASRWFFSLLILSFFPTYTSRVVARLVA